MKTKIRWNLIQKTYKVLLILILNLTIYCTCNATNYVYPNAQSGYTVFTPGNSITSADTLSFNADFSSNPYFVFFMQAGSYTINNLIAPTTVNANFGRGVGIIILGDTISLAGTLNFTLPPNIIWNGTGTNGIGVYSAGTSASSINVYIPQNSKMIADGMGLYMYPGQGPTTAYITGGTIISNFDASVNITGNSNLPTGNLNMSSGTLIGNIVINYVTSAINISGGTVTGDINLASAAVTMVLSGGATIYGAINNVSATCNVTMNGATITNGISAINSLTIGGSTTSTISGGISQIPVMTVNANSTVSLSGTTSVTSLTNNGTITNLGTLSLTSTLFNNTGLVTNTGTITVNGLTTWSGSGTVNSTNTLNIQSNIATLNNIVNGGNMTIAAALSGGGQITNSSTGILTLSSTGSNANPISNSGTINVNGNFFNPAAITNSGTINIGIRSATNYDSINANGSSVDLSNGIVNINSTFVGNNNQQYSWTVLSAASITKNNSTQIISPASTLFNYWSASIDNIQKNIIVTHNVTDSFTAFATTTTNQSVATVLDNMSQHITNSQQQILVNAFSSYQNVTAYNAGLQQMLPNNNANTTNIAVQNKAIGKVETRLASLRNGYSDSDLGGIAAGDMCNDYAFWMGGYGSTANQRNTAGLFGYKAKTLGFILGLDKEQDDSYYGIAVTVSKTIVHENSNQNFETSIYNYQTLLYGTWDFDSDIFIEWLVTGAINRNYGSRAININNVIMSTTSNYTGELAGFKFNYGQNYNFDTFVLAPLTNIQYTFIHVPNFTENPSPAALTITQQDNQNVLTLGLWARLSFPLNEKKLFAMQELRFGISYDAIVANNATYSSFASGSSQFIINSITERLAFFNFGIDLSYEIYSSLYLQFSYDLQLRKTYTDNSGMLKLKYLF